MKEYHTIKDLGIEKDKELLKYGETIFGSKNEFEIWLNQKEVPITKFESPKNMLLKKGFCRKTLQTTIDILVALAEKINQTQGTGRKELIEILKKMQ